ncbi:MAG: helicase-related protein [archaeon YNP-WB-062]|jgi:Fanconi anemia group M protein|nr:helicase-related protein [Candidatus Culexarchaeum yellowstonense]
MRKSRDEWWENYKRYLDESPISITKLVETLSPNKVIPSKQYVKINKKYTLWEFQREILDKIASHNYGLIVGLPTGLGKTYVAGAYLERRSSERGVRVLFLVPSVPLGVQQTIFAREKLGVEDAYFISGAIPPERRMMLKVWNTGFVVTTPQTFANDHLYPFKDEIKRMKNEEEGLMQLRELFKVAEFEFPYDIVVADECQKYIGETDGYAILMAAKACGKKVLALSATPQLHSKTRLAELKRIFDVIEVFSLEHPSIRKHIPPRILYIVRLETPQKLLEVYQALSRQVSVLESEIRKLYGSRHLDENCSEHPICRRRMTLKLLTFRLIEDGASSVLRYRSWRLPELNQPLEELNGKSIIKAYREALKENFNHKIDATIKILEAEKYSKGIVFAEAIEVVKQVGKRLQEKFGVEDVAIMVGKGEMTLEQQASALLQFREKARILVATSVGEEGLDIPAADIEIWIDPPSNPQKWIQRFGRILRQTEEKVARTYALISMQTHERNKLLGIMRKCTEIYGFTQKVAYIDINDVSSGQTTLTSFMGNYR